MDHATSYPGIPPDSSLFAISTSHDQTSNCHFRRPSTPHSTDPECIPIRMSMSCFVLDLTYLFLKKYKKNTRSAHAIKSIEGCNYDPHGRVASSPHVLTLLQALSDNRAAAELTPFRFVTCFKKAWSIKCNINLACRDT